MLVLLSSRVPCVVVISQRFRLRLSGQLQVIKPATSDVLAGPTRIAIGFATPFLGTRLAPHVSFPWCCSRNSGHSLRLFSFEALRASFRY